MHPVQSQLPPLANSRPSVETKDGHLILTKGQIKAVHHLNSFLLGKESGISFIENHSIAAFSLRLFSRVFAATGIGYVAMLGSAAFVDKMDNLHAASKNKDLKSHQNKVFELFKNHIALDLRPAKAHSIKEGKELQTALKNDERINKAIKELITSISVKIGNSSFEDTLVKYEDAIKYFVKKAEKQDLPEIVIKDAKTYLSQNYCEALTLQLGNEYAKKIPSKQEFDAQSGKLFSFIRENVNTTEAVVKNNILLAAKKNLGGETLKTLQQKLSAESACFDSDENAQVKAKVEKLKTTKGTSVIDGGTPEEGSLEAQLQGVRKGQNFYQEQLSQKNSLALTYLISAHYADNGINPAVLPNAQANPNSKETNDLLNAAFPEPFQTELMQNHAPLCEILRGRAALKQDVESQQKMILDLEQQINDIYVKISQPHYLAIKQELKQPLESQMEVLKMIENSHELNANTQFTSEQSALENTKYVFFNKEAQAHAVCKILEKVYSPTVDDIALQERIHSLSNNGKRVYELIVEQAIQNGNDVPEWDKQYAMLHAYPSLRDRDGRPVVNDRSALANALEAYANELLIS